MGLCMTASVPEHCMCSYQLCILQAAFMGGVVLTSQILTAYFLEPAPVTTGLLMQNSC